MKQLTILINNSDDCLLYVDGKAYNDIDDDWARCILWLKDIISDNVDVVTTHLERKDYPDQLENNDLEINRIINWDNPNQTTTLS